jgi:hypothetical protein
VCTNAIYIALSYKHTPRTEVAYTNCLISSLNISIGKTPVPSSSILFAYPSIDRKPYYNSSLSLNRSIDLTSISL